MWKNLLKFLGLAAIVVLLGFGVLLGIQYVRYRNSPEYRAELDLKNLEKQYAEDPYGGDTPEETLRLFIDALKKGDTDLAAKYFVLDKQKEWREDLSKLKDKNLLDETVADFERLKLSKKTEREAFFTLIGADGIGTNVILYKNFANGLWKIGEF